MEFAAEVGERFVGWLKGLSQGTSARVHIVCDFDGDGLPAGALLYCALRAAGYAATTVECRRKGESAWGEEIRAAAAGAAGGGGWSSGYRCVDL